MGAGKLVSVLVGTRADQYMEFRAIDGSYVFRKETGQVLKVPSTPGEATTTPLVGMFQKFYLRQFLSFLISCKEDDKSQCYLYPRQDKCENLM